MEKPKHHIFVCASFRASGELQGVCYKKGSHSFMSYLESELADRDMTDVVVSSTGCLKLCDKGPIMVIHPENWWYGNVENEDAIDAILDALKEGESCKEYLL